MFVVKKEILFYSLKNNLVELFKHLSDGEDNSLRITHHALRLPEKPAYPLTLNPLQNHKPRHR